MKLSDLLEEFNVVIDTAEGLNELRSLILGLAIRGKLVPQNLNDEPASELLKKIKEEQARLYDEGKIRKPKDLDSLSESELPFTIPDNWIWERMGNISDVIRGITFPGSEKKDEKGSDDILCLKTSNIQDKVEWDDVIYVDESYVKREDQYLQINDIVISMANSYELVGKVALADQIPENSSFGGFLSVIRPFLFEPLYYFYLLRSNYVQEAFRESSSQTVNIANISLKVMLPIPMPLPPLAEQHRIVQKIESLFAEVDELEEKLNRQTKLDEKLQVAVNAEVQQAPDAEASKTAWNFITSNFDTLYHTPEAIDNLKKNILNEAVRGRLVSQDPNDEPASELLKKIEVEKQRLYDEGEIRKPKDLPMVKEDEIPFEIPESWEWSRLGNVILETDAGKSPSCEKRPVSEKEWGVLTTTSIQENEFLEKENKVLPEKFEVQKKYIVHENDVLITRAGPLNRTGITCHVDQINYKLILSDKTIRLRHHLDYTFPRYTPYVLNSSSLRPILESSMTGMAESQVNISQTNIHKLIFPLPPLEEQHRIVLRIEELFAICDRFKAQLEQREEVNKKLVKGMMKEVLE